VFEAVNAEVAALIPADGSFLNRYETNGTAPGRGRITAASGRMAEQIGRSYPLEGTVSGVIFETGRPGRVDYANAPGEGPEAAREMGWRSSVGAPVTVDGSLWGVLAVVSMSDEQLPRGTEQRLAQFTELVATAIANSEAHEELTRLANEQAALRRVAMLAAKGAQPVEVFEAVSEEVAGLFRADAGAVMRYEADGTLTAAGGWTASGGFAPTGMRFALEGSVSGLIFETGRPARIDTFDGVAGETAAAMRDMGWGTAAGAPISVEGRLWGTLVVYSMSTEPFSFGTEDRLARFGEIVATAIASSASREEITRLADEQAALRRVATLVAQGVGPLEIFAAVSDELSRLFGAEQAAIGRFEPDGSALVVVGASGGVQGVSVGGRWPLEDFLATTAVYRTGRTARTDQRDLEGASGPVAERLREIGFISTVSAPIIVEGTLWGVMTLSDRRQRLPPDTEERVENFTELVATAIANAESRAELEASRSRIVATADATRRRIERDLHDGAQQRLLSLALELRAAQAAVPAEMATHRAELDHVAEGLTNVLDGLREIALGLHPAILAEGGLSAALKTLAQRSPIPVSLEVQAERRLPEHVEVAAYYIVSEALTNAAKHARASKVDVDVVVRDRALSVAVADDGLGGADPARGSGLLGLKDRAAAIGGTLVVASRPGEGTNLVAELPLGTSTG
jgi:signal transduction histidine kinase